jgi:TetR/AcrR family transcriptional regulator, regulator of autoinduction and epiphytic fitness
VSPADSKADPPGDAERHDALLRTALVVFARFGYRKTSMDEIARAAGLSRQGLYLRFRSKEELFRAMVTHLLETSLRHATAVLSDCARPIRERLVRGFDEWAGWYADMVHGPGVAELLEASATMVQPVIDDHEARFERELVKAIRASGLAAAHKPSGVSAPQLTQTLQAVARGLKHMVTTRAAFVEGIDRAVRALCTPLGDDR